MASQPTTLRHVLTQAKPSPRRTWTKPFSKNTANSNWPKLDSISIWNEFNLTNLNDSYGHILDLSLADPLSPMADEILEDVVLARARDMNHLIRWNNEIIAFTIRFAKTQLRLYPGSMLGLKYTPVDQPVEVKLPGMPPVFLNHIISLDDHTERFLVVGFGRQSPRWSGRELARELDRPRAALVWPLQQLANICRRAETRYGYIQTDEELVVCRFSVCANGHFNVKFMPVPWSKNGADALTTDLALWWLCMLAMSGSEHRVIIREEDIVEVNEWDIVSLDENRGWIRRHRYSNFEEHVSTPPPPSYRSPSPFNLAAPTPRDDILDMEWPDSHDDFYHTQAWYAATFTGGNF
ncbi:hypothetical protein E4U21_006596 [Claviceps maximensis]|nr:hypothetical protein E4U21_006596 [Claviceps maximensis]